MAGNIKRTVASVLSRTSKKNDSEWAWIEGILSQFELIVMPTGKEIVDVVVGKPGATSDIKLWRERARELSDNQKFQGDKAYVGEPAIDTPHKKTRSKGVTVEQKQDN